MRAEVCIGTQIGLRQNDNALIQQIFHDFGRVGIIAVPPLSIGGGIALVMDIVLHHDRHTEKVALRSTGNQRRIPFPGHFHGIVAHGNEAVIGLVIFFDPLQIVPGQLLAGNMAFPNGLGHIGDIRLVKAVHQLIFFFRCQRRRQHRAKFRLLPFCLGRQHQQGAKRKYAYA